ITFDPIAGFTKDPTPIKYTITEVSTGLISDTATVSAQFIPIALPDATTYTPGNPKTINILANDTLGVAVLPNSVSLVGGSNPDAQGDNLSLVVAGEGTWTVNPTTGAITFTPLSTFVGNPTPVQYTVKSTNGTSSLPTPVVILIDPIPAMTSNDLYGYAFGVPKTINILINDINGSPLDSTSISIIAPINATNAVLDAQGDIIGFKIPGEGTWSVNTTNGKVTFTPESGFLSNPAPIGYSARNLDGNLSNISTITLLGSALADKLLSFEVNLQRNNNILKWKISNENDYAIFEIEKSKNGVNFEKIGTLDTKSNSLTNFIFTDIAPSNNNYYRLKMIDKNGGTSYSKTIYIKNVFETKVSVYPTITTDNFSVKYNDDSKTQSIRIFNSIGKLAKEYIQDDELFNVNKLPSGQYLVEITTNKGKKTVHKLRVFR
ncbi:MAG: T9SS type A sorting domain-containing protein, partial [Pseudarcicella sp.]|nr:T9SS type A sorting domain-containing protein [Pseudarcicella sp.]